MHLDPLSGSLFLFKNKRGDRIKVLYFDSDGFAMWYKVLQRGTFQFPDLQNFSSAGLEINASTLRMILDGIDLGSIRRRDRYRAPHPSSIATQPLSGLSAPLPQIFAATIHPAATPYTAVPIDSPLDCQRHDT
jgi:hypothetical protein